MADNKPPLQYDKWTLDYGISKCEGLVASSVTLGPRLMAERMSLPYLNVKTCAGPDPTHCGATTERHIVLRPAADEPQADPSAYTHVALQHTSNCRDVSSCEVKAPSSGPCYSNTLCDHEVISATYRVDFAPSSAGSGQNYLDITQRYEFYRDFPEDDNHELSCEPFKDAGVTAGLVVTGLLAAPLEDCGRWKAPVRYQYHEGTSGQALVSVNAAQRLHFTPDATAIRASAFFRDCEPNSQTQCHDALGHLEELNRQTALANESIVRAFSNSPGGTVEGRFDNLHQTPADDVLKPGLNFTPLPHVAPGCPECVHMHWRWGQDILDGRVSAAFGNGQPLVRDAEPAALPGPPTTHQQLDVAQVAYHSDELAPTDYAQLVIPGQSDGPIERQLDVSFDNEPSHFLHGSYYGGSVTGTEPLEHPSGSCSVPDDPATWGQCGEVTWLSATSFNDAADHEQSDTFFAFGGFFCGMCFNTNYSHIIAGTTPHYAQTLSRRCQMTISPLERPVSVPCEATNLTSGQPFHVIFGNGPGQDDPVLQVSDTLPMGTTKAAGQIRYNATGGFLGLGSGIKTKACDVGRASSGAPLVLCVVPDNVDNYLIDVSGTAPVRPVTVANTVHATWGDSATNSALGGNYKRSDPLTFAPDSHAVSASGTVGRLMLGKATAQDVIKQVGTPDEELSHPGERGIGGGTGTGPPYQELGFGCQTPGDRANLVPLTSDQAGPGCRTVYFVNQSTGRLAGFRTTDPTYHTTAGTAPGMPQARANSLEGNVATAGCLQGINEDTREAGLWIENVGGAVAADGTITGGTVGLLALDEGPGRPDYIGRPIC